MNNYFINITKTLNLKPCKCSNAMNINEIISTFDNHISIKKIKEYFPDASSNNFEFKEISQDEVKKEVSYLNVKKLSAISKYLYSSNNSETVY